MKYVAPILLCTALLAGCRSSEPRAATVWAVEDVDAWDLSGSERQLESLTRNVLLLPEDGRQDAWNTRIDQLTSQLNDVLTKLEPMTAESAPEEVKSNMLAVKRLRDAISRLRDELTAELSRR